jgi:hypothetical protein
MIRTERLVGRSCPAVAVSLRPGLCVEVSEVVDRRLSLVSECDTYYGDVLALIDPIVSDSLSDRPVIPIRHVLSRSTTMTRSVVQPFLLAFSLSLVWNTCRPSETFAGQLLPKDANLMVLEEVQSIQLSYMGYVVGADPSRPLGWTGSITDSSWTFDMASSPYRDGTLTASASGVFDPQKDIVTWTQTATFSNSAGSVSLTADGLYTGASQTDPGMFMMGRTRVKPNNGSGVVPSLAITGLQVAAILTAAGLDGPEVILVSLLGYSGIAVNHGIISAATVNKSVDGSIITTVNVQGTSGPFVSPFPLDNPGLTQATYPGILVRSTSQLSGVYTDPSVFVSGVDTLTALPEPSSLMLGLVGVVGGVVCYAARWPGRQPGSPGRR